MIYVLSDVHGHERRFDSILKQINLKSEDTLYVLGDVIDRHPGGIRILRKIMAMPNAKMLLGNHEYMMLQALGCPYEPCDESIDKAMERWYRNGGKVTHDHWKRIRKSLRSEILQYLLALPLNIDIEVSGNTYKLVHGAPIEAYSSDSANPSAIHFAVWKRWGLNDSFGGNDTIIFGHTPTRYYQEGALMKLWHGDRLIGIDCGCGYPEDGIAGQYGRLACLRLDDGTVFYSEEEVNP